MLVEMVQTLDFDLTSGLLRMLDEESKISKIYLTLHSDLSSHAGDSSEQLFFFEQHASDLIYLTSKAHIQRIKDWSSTKSPRISMDTKVVRRQQTVLASVVLWTLKIEGACSSPMRPREPCKKWQVPLNHARMLSGRL